MPWKTKNLITMREEFVRLASAPGANKRELMRRFQISPPTAYKWLSRYAEGGLEALIDRSRRPARSPGKSSDEIEQKVVLLREEFPCWGGRKLAKVLHNRGEQKVPSASTITEILRRHGMLRKPKREQKAWQRFEKERPNEMWQMDFKGDFEMRDKRRCYPLTACDDNSRYNVILKACSDMKTETVRSHLEAAFRRYGMPESILCDNGGPWSSNWGGYATRLEVWLMLLGVKMLHGRPYHPQTQGKEERFHQTLKVEVIERNQGFVNREKCQKALSEWREIYNWVRPHESIEMDVPGDRYECSTRAMPKDLAPERWYLPGDDLRKVQGKGIVEYKAKRLSVGESFGGYQVALRPHSERQVTMWFASKMIGIYDLSEQPVGQAAIRRKAKETRNEGQEE